MEMSHQIPQPYMISLFYNHQLKKPHSIMNKASAIYSFMYVEFKTDLS